MEILIGVLSSLIATIIWFACFQLYDINDRKKIDAELKIVMFSINKIDSCLRYDEYDILISEIDKVIDGIIRINGNIKRLTYLPKKKRLICTLCSSLILLCENIKNTEIGYKGEQEIKQRCEVIRNNLDNLKTSFNDESILYNTVNLLMQLNQVFSVTKSIYRVFSPEIKKNMSQTENEMLYGIIYPNAFKQVLDSKYDMRYNAFTREKYEKYIKRKI